MQILIIGAGDVGSNVARDLSESHDLTIIDRDAERVGELTAHLDATGVVDDGRSLTALREAGLERADVVIASTDNDATNVMVCNAAERVGDPHTIARVKDVGLFRAWQSSESGFGVDTMLDIDLLAARALVRTITLPGARDVGMFADGQAEVAEFRVGEDTPVTNRTVAEADSYPSLTFAAIVRGDDVLIPDGETVIEPGDDLVVIGSQSAVSRFAADVSDRPAPEPDDEIMVVGGDPLGYQIARLFEERDLSTRVVERDPERVTWLRDRLRESTVLEVDATDVEEFGKERLADVDFVVGAVDDDTNYLLAQLARELGTARTAAIVDDSRVLDLFEESGLDLVVHPEDIIAGEILERVYRRRAEGVSVLEHDSAEVLEIVVDTESILAGDSLADVAHHLPSGFVIGAVIRGGTLRTPRGGTIIQTGDRVIAFVDSEVVSEVAEKI
ncbi:Trk system potassium transporter TrkA [Halalkalicoccus sp. NIPERK01]|uniref:Trk system potassium transporter TrkA n=1 Tax=Halalkalicoccus sp. NIPERK01 TaxID=3053469 RepID=UPI00256F3FA6|nr:Trk system potassium transporter TrkA [Halalkalicoccus sp. NIPERK01]MDL5362718.1 Trk system potassium transporter TrkA [Halalkalicoccus sp. NIPERK01]